MEEIQKQYKRISGRSFKENSGVPSGRILELQFSEISHETLWGCKWNSKRVFGEIYGEICGAISCKFTEDGLAFIQNFLPAILKAIPAENFLNISMQQLWKQIA